MKRNEPLVSIIVPAYNVEKYIKQCISSIIGQTYSNIEIIIVDDGSVDTTNKIINDFARKDKRLRLINTNRQGANRARGLAIEQASGDYYMFVDSDDWVDKNAVKKLVGIMVNNEYDIVRFNAVVEPGNKLKNSYINQQSNAKMLAGDEARRMLVTTRILNSLCFQFYRAELLKEVKSFHDQLSNCEDYFNNMEIYDNVKKVFFLEDVLYHYRDNHDSTTKNSNPDRCFNNLNEQLYVQSVVSDKVAVWNFAPHERKEVAILALDKIRGSMFAFSKSDGMKREYFLSRVNSIMANDKLEAITRDIREVEIDEFIRKQSLLYKIKCNGSLKYIYRRDAASFWRVTSLFRMVSRIKSKIHYGRIGG